MVRDTDERRCLDRDASSARRTSPVFLRFFFRLSAVLQVRKYFHDQVRREEKTRRRRRGRRQQESPSSLSNQNLSSSDPTSPSSPLLQRQQPTSLGFPSSPSLFSSPSTQPQESLDPYQNLAASSQLFVFLPYLPSSSFSSKSHHFDHPSFPSPSK